MSLKSLYELNHEFKMKRLKTLTNKNMASDLTEPPEIKEIKAVETKTAIEAPETGVKSLHELNHEFQRQQETKS